MGQYHAIANLDKREFLNPWDMGEGAKLMEWGYGSGTMLTALAILLAVSNGRGGGDYHGDEDDPTIAEWVGRWGGDRIAVIGDYTELDDLPHEFQADAIWTAMGNARKAPKTLDERISENEQRRGLYGETVDAWNEVERRAETIPYTNISAQMRRVIEADGRVHFTVEKTTTRHLDGTIEQDDYVRSADGPAPGLTRVLG